MPDQPDELEVRLASVRSSIADACAQAGRDPSAITTVVVTKFQPASLVRELHHLGVRDFGENRHQDAAPKAAELHGLELTWHFVGQLQSKKARQVRQYATVIHSLDRESLVDALSAQGDPVDVFVQLDLSGEPGRGGIRDDELETFAERVLGADGLRLLGLMAVAPLGADARESFARVRTASERLQALAPEATALSMGMSGDYREAILEGATHLRIGTAITGNRPQGG